MELNVRLNAKDVNTDGVFAALEMLCLCFKPQDERSFTIHPTEEKAAQQTANATKPTVEATPAPQIPVTTMAQPIPTAPVPQSAPAGIPTAPTPQSAPAGIPTMPPVAQTPQYDMMQVAQAAVTFSESVPDGRDKVAELIHKFGANALTEIPQNRLGEFATALRGMGRVSDAGGAR